jgi:hypothetical protein
MLPEVLAMEGKTATCGIGGEASKTLPTRGHEVEVYPEVDSPPKSLTVEKVHSGIGGLITRLRDRIDAEVFAAGHWVILRFCGSIWAT